MARITQAQVDALEALIDSTDLNQVLDSIAQICNAKAEHQRTNWQDTYGAKVWDGMARRIARAVNYAHVHSI